MQLRHLIPLLLLSTSATAFADIIDINLRDNSAQLQYKSSMGRDALGNTEFHAGALYAGSDRFMADLGLLVKDELGGNAPGFSVGVGIKGVMAKVKDNASSTKNATAIALGAMVRYSPPSAPRAGIAGEFYLSPNITTFGDADRYVEGAIRLEYEVIPAAVAYIGYRKVSLALTNLPHANVDEGGYLGVRISF